MVTRTILGYKLLHHTYKVNRSGHISKSLYKIFFALILLKIFYMIGFTTTSNLKHSTDDNFNNFGLSVQEVYELQRINNEYAEPLFSKQNGAVPILPANMKLNIVLERTITNPKGMLYRVNVNDNKILQRSGVSLNCTLYVDKKYFMSLKVTDDKVYAITIGWNEIAGIPTRETTEFPNIYGLTLKEKMDKLPEGTHVVFVGTTNGLKNCLSGEDFALIIDYGSAQVYKATNEKNKIDQDRRVWSLIGRKGLDFPSPFEAAVPIVDTSEARYEDEEYMSIATNSTIIMQVEAKLPMNSYDIRQEALIKYCLDPEVQRIDPEICGHDKTVKYKNENKRLESQPDYMADYIISEDDRYKYNVLPVPEPMDPNITFTRANKLPMVILSGNQRPRYLAICLRHLFKIPGVNPKNVWIHQDGDCEVSRRLARIYGVSLLSYPKAVSTIKGSKKIPYIRADQIAMHYWRALYHTFEAIPKNAHHSIILEEDLMVSPDFLSYFSQTLPLLEADKTILSISAWNDNAYSGRSHDSSMLYRSDFFPGLGWLLSRGLWEELKSKWPKVGSGASWDLWLRDRKNHGRRETIFPDVPRVFHFGRNGANVDNVYFYGAYFYNHNLNTDKYALVDGLRNMTKHNYQLHMADLFSRSAHYNYTGDGSLTNINDVISDCRTIYNDNPDIPAVVIWYHQNNIIHKANLDRLVSALGLWDLGTRGIYRRMIRLHIEDIPIIIAGDNSRYGMHFMPDNIKSLVVNENIEDRVDINRIMNKLNADKYHFADFDV